MARREIKPAVLEQGDVEEYKSYLEQERREQGHRPSKEQTEEKKAKIRKNAETRKEWKTRIEQMSKDGLLNEGILSRLQIFTEQEPWKVLSGVQEKKLWRGSKEITVEDLLDDAREKREKDALTLKKNIEQYLDKTARTSTDSRKWAVHRVAQGLYGSLADENLAEYLLFFSTGKKNESKLFEGENCRHLEVIRRMSERGETALDGRRGISLSSEMGLVEEGVYQLMVGAERYLNRENTSHRSLSFYRFDFLSLVRILTEQPAIWKYIFGSTVDSDTITKFIEGAGMASYDTEVKWDGNAYVDFPHFIVHQP